MSFIAAACSVVERINRDAAIDDLDRGLLFSVKPQFLQGVKERKGGMVERFSGQWWDDQQGAGQHTQNHSSSTGNSSRSTKGGSALNQLHG